MKMKRSKCNACRCYFVRSYLMNFFFSLSVCLSSCVCVWWKRRKCMRKRDTKREREKEWSFSLRSNWTRKKKRINSRLICQEARIAGQIFIYGRSWTYVMVQGRRTSQEKKGKRKKYYYALFCSLSTYIYASSHFNVHLERWQGHNILRL